MDKKETGKELPEDVTRESLIAISYRLPDNDLSAEKSPRSINGQKIVEPPVCDEDEKHRSKLISIAYSPSPDTEVLPALRRQADD